MGKGTETEVTELVSPPSGPHPRSLRERLSNPYLGAIGFFASILTILSFFLGFVFYFYPYRAQKELTYSYPYASNKVFDSKSATTYKILDQNNTVITNDIYTTEFDLWNSGAESIEPSNVLSPVRVVLFPVQRILEYKIVTQVRGDIANITVREVDVNGSAETLARYDSFTATTKNKIPINDIDRRAFTKVLEIRWDHLEVGFGVKILVSYVGQGAYDKDFRVVPDAYIAGMPRMHFGQQLILARWLGWSHNAMTLLNIFGMLGLMILSIGISVFVINNAPIGKSHLFGLVTIGCGLVMFGLFVTLINAKTAPAPFEIPSSSPPPVVGAEG